MRHSAVGWLALPLIVGFLLVPQGRAASAKKALPQRFYFAQITDTHWGALDGLAQTRKAVTALNRLPMRLEFVVHTGDVFADSIRNERVVQEGLEAMQALRAPVYYVPGNHDILKDAPEDTTRLFRMYFGEVNSRVEVRGVLCLFVCTELLPGDSRSPAQAQRETLAELTRGIGGHPTLVFMHRPPVSDRLDPARRGDSAEEGGVGQWDAVLESAPGIKAVIAGHLHRDELHWIGRTPVYVAAPVARFWERQPSVRLYEYEDGRLQYWTIYLSDRVEDRSARAEGDQRPPYSKTVKPGKE
jgi:3',5'-cyclic AMP phosphodiesterase CpdA